MDCFNCLHRLNAFGLVFGSPWTVLVVCIASWNGLDCLLWLACGFGLDCWVVFVVCIIPWICPDSVYCFDCLDWFCDAWAVLFVYSVSWICWNRVDCVYGLELFFEWS